MVTFDEIIRYRNRQTGPRFNIIGFSNASDWRPTKSCVICHVILIPRTNLETGEQMPGLQCPKCGSPYSEQEVPSEEQITGKFKGTQQTRIISAKSKKKYYDKQGNEINDPDLIADIQRRGATVYSYYEEKHGEDTFIDKNTRRIIRARKK